MTQPIPLYGIPVEITFSQWLQMVQQLTTYELAMAGHLSPGEASADNINPDDHFIKNLTQFGDKADCTVEQDAFLGGMAPGDFAKLHAQRIMQG